MPVELIFNAPDVKALNEQIVAYVRALATDTVVPKTAAEVFVPIDPFAEIVSQSLATDAALADLAEAKKKANKPNKPNKEKTPAKTPEPPVELSPEPPIVEEPPVDPEPEPPVAVDAKDLVTLKDTTIRTLQLALADGKVAKLRAILDAYGDGAKSFPEIPAKNFVLIDAAIQKGALR